MKSKIVSIGPIDEAAVKILEPYGEFIQSKTTKEQSLVEMETDAIALIVRGDGAITRPIIEAASHLKVIGRTGVGYDNIDIEAATERKVPVVFTPGANARVVAEASMALVLAHCKRIVYWDRQLKSGNWASRNNFSTLDMEESTLGIVGFGQIGRIVSQLAAPFNMRIIAHDPYVSKETAESFKVELTSLDSLLNQADFICLHAVLTDKTKGLINRNNLKLVKEGSFLINLARGPLIESLDILDEALETGVLAGVGLDVFSPEPPDTTHSIFKRENCLTAPHSLAMTKRSMLKVFIQMAEDMAAVLDGKHPCHSVNPEVFD